MKFFFITKQTLVKIIVTKNLQTPSYVSKLSVELLIGNSFGYNILQFNPRSLNYPEIGLLVHWCFVSLLF